MHSRSVNFVKSPSTLYETNMASSAALLPSVRAAGSTPGLPSLQRRVRDFQIVLAGVAVLWLGGEVAACFGIGTSPTKLASIHLRADPAAMISLACAFLFFLFARPSGREFAALGVVTL